MLIDTHAHIYLDQFSEDLNEVINRAEEEKVKSILMPNIDSTTISLMKDVEDKYVQCQSMMGLHPCSVKEDFEEELKLVETELSSGRYIGVGEIGTDLYWDKTFWEEQKIVFERQLSLSEKYALPVAIHCRETLDETIEMVSDFAGKISGVFHCFTGDLEQGKKIRNLGFYVGLGGVSTFKNSGMHEMLSKADLDNVVLETDSPYLAPSPMRGKRNEPSYIYHVALNLAQQRGLPFSEIAEITTNNAKRLFGI